MKTYYTYVYYDEDWNPYYVGKGEGRRSFRLRSVPRPPRERIQTFYFAHEWAAYECEVQLINFWGRRCDGGCLMNLALGGAGSPGVKHTDETRKRMSKSHMGLKHTPDVEQRRIEKCKARLSKVLSLINPAGEVISFPSRRAASRTTGLNRSSIHRLITGEFKQIKGWRLANA